MKTGILSLGLLTTLGCIGATAQNINEDTKPLKSPSYTISRAAETPLLDGQWEGPAWKSVPTLEVAHFYLSDRSKHKPKTEAKVVYDDSGIYIHFRVEDRYVRAIETEYHGKVWEDACAEFFVEPVAGRGYFNFEMNCGGTLLLSYHENPSWKGKTLLPEGDVPEEMTQAIRRFHSQPKTVEPENPEPVVWQLEYYIPFSLLEAYVGELGDVAGQTWRANFYKCAENNSHPHWASWAPIEGALDFHKPEYFAPIHFKK